MEFFAQRIEKTAISRLEEFVEKDFAQVDYTDAVEILKNCGKKFEFDVEWGVDLQSEHERYLAEEHFKAPVVIKNYPRDIKAFYMRLNDDGKTVRAMDILFPLIGEIVGGSQREENLELLEKRMDEMDVDKQELWWYLESRKFGTCVHSGFGLGFERLIMFVTGMKNIRDVIPFPRTPQNAEF
jgi:asparaginyl-tRNA synthetase